MLGMINMLEGAAEGGVQKVLFASSGGAAYGEQETFPAPETHHDLRSALRRHQATGELYCFFYQAEYGMPFVALRYANVYGPRQDPHGEAGVVAIFSGKLLRGEPVDRQRRRQADARLRLRRRRRAHEPAGARARRHRAGQHRHRHRDRRQRADARRCAMLTGSRVRGAARPGQGGRAAPQRDRDRGAPREVLGWQPEVPLERACARTVEFFRRAPGSEPGAG